MKIEDCERIVEEWSNTSEGVGALARRAAVEALEWVDKIIHKNGLYLADTVEEIETAIAALKEKP